MIFTEQYLHKKKYFIPKSAPIVFFDSIGFLESTVHRIKEELLNLLDIVSNNEK